MSFNSKSLPPASPEQIARWVDAAQKGCLKGGSGECDGPLEQHHLKSGNLRMGHWFTICLCRKHHGEAARLARDHGNEGLMQWQDDLLGYITPRIMQRNRKSKCTASSKTFPRRFTNVR